MGLVMLLIQSSPIMVRVIEQPAESTSVSDILIGALGLTGVLLLAAAVLGVLLGGVLVGIKLVRARYNLEAVPDSESMRVTPTRM
ncbi:MAG: hypothetical protein LC804_08525 [Acidobacteria bacterium]|nr:hypothetical protein [Acidobacteriota bacterium]